MANLMEYESMEHPLREKENYYLRVIPVHESWTSIRSDPLTDFYLMWESCPYSEPPMDIQALVRTIGDS